MFLFQRFLGYFTPVRKVAGLSCQCSNFHVERSLMSCRAQPRHLSADWCQRFLHLLRSVGMTVFYGTLVFKKKEAGLQVY